MVIDEHSEYSKFLKGIVICKTSGEYLLDLILDSEINPILLSSFVGALSLFGKGSLGKIEEITIKGLDVQMIIVAKNELILIAIMDKYFVSESLREEASKALDTFYGLYKEDINDCLDVNKFCSFKEILSTQIEDYFKKIEKSKTPVADFGFFTTAIEKMRKDS